MSTYWEGKSKGNLIGYKIFFYLLKMGGIAAAYQLLNIIKYYYIWFMPKATKPLYCFYKNKLGFTNQEAKKNIKKNILLFGQSLIDKFVLLAQIKNHPLTVNHIGVEHLDAMILQGKGGILVSAHLGNWEAAGHLLKKYNTKINIVMYDGEVAEMKRLLAQFNNQRSFKIIPISEDLSHIYEMTAALNRNEFICLHADRFRPDNRTFQYPLLGAMAHFPAGPFILASKMKAPVSFVFALKEGKFHYQFSAEKPKTYEGKGAEGAMKMLEDYIKIVEQKIKIHPEQWFNYYDFWAAQP